MKKIIHKKRQKHAIEFGTNFRPLQNLRYMPLTADTYMIATSIQCALSREIYSSLGFLSPKIFLNGVEIPSLKRFNNTAPMVNDT